MTGSRTPRAVLMVVLTVGLVAAACGLPVSDEVEVLAQDDHRELLDGTTSTTSAVADPEDDGSPRVALYFIGPDDKLERVIRKFPQGTTRGEVLAALEEPPLDTEIEEFADLGNLQTLLPAGLNPQMGATDEGREAQVITVDPVADLRLIVDEQLEFGRLIASQIVCTVLSMSIEGVSGVEIVDGEEPIQISDINAEPILGPATLEDFDNCRTGTQQREEDRLLEEAAEQESTTTSG